MKKNLLFASTLFAVMLAVFSCNSKKTEDANATAEENAGEAAATELKAFDYTPAEPTNGKKKAIVELGAAGFNMFVVELDEQGNWKALKKEFGTSLISENMTNAETVETKLRDYIKSIIDFGVEGSNVFFVVSSGAVKEPVIESITTALKTIGYNVNTVSPEEEAQYAFRGTLPKGYEGKAFVVDLGSGNTKISYVKDGKTVGVETYGAKYFQKNVTDDEVYNDVKVKLADIPQENTETLFIIGGVPFQMAKTLKKGDERYTVLSTDIAVYDKLAQEEGDKVKAGLNIFKAIVQTTGAKQVVFDWDANFSIGYLLSLPY